jgi:tRNA-splicing ligase RtcB
MEITSITNDELATWGIVEPEVQEKFLRISNGLIQHGVMPKTQIIHQFLKLLEDPATYAKKKGKFYNIAQYVANRKEAGHELPLTETGKSLLQTFDAETKQYEREKLDGQVTGTYALNEQPSHYVVYGKEAIEEGAYKQMDVAMKLPITEAGALMPDAHQGYGLPIGGVLATRPNTIIPYAVGVDIACRMCMSVFDIPSSALQKAEQPFTKILMEHTYFGLGTSTRRKFNEDLFDKPEWEATKVIRDLKYKAYEQLGTSGTGNHFVEWGVLEVAAQDDLLGLAPGDYLALLSHSGSRGFGGAVAGHYSKLAMKKTILPDEAKHLAWLDMNSEEGMEYWIAMNLAGEYASANHHEIHNKIAKALGTTPLKRIENHHNFAWKETLEDGREVMVHRKGATPASAEELGIIPGSMTQPGFVIRGKGNPASLQSASHGAGRQMSRTKAFQTISKESFKKVVEEAGIELIGSDLDEAPMAYKDIYGVIANQKDLVHVLAKFTPKIVRMAQGKEKAED